MKINMKEVKLVKKEGYGNWILVEEILGTDKIYTKLAYNDGHFTKEEIKLLGEKIRNRNAWNFADMLDDYTGTGDYALTFLGALKGSGKMSSADTFEKVEKTVVLEGIRLTAGTNFEQNEQSDDEFKSMIASLLVDSANTVEMMFGDNPIGDLKTKIFGEMFGVYAPAFTAVAKKCQIKLADSSLTGVIDLFKNGVEYTPIEIAAHNAKEENKDKQLKLGDKKYTNEAVKEMLYKEVILNRLSADVMSAMMSSGVMAAKSGGVVGAIVGVGMFAESKPFSAGLKIYLSEHWEEVKEGNFDVSTLMTEVKKANMDFFNVVDNFFGASSNFIEWEYKGEKLATELEVDAPGMVDGASKGLLEYWKEEKEKIAGDTTIKGVKKIIGSVEGVTKLLNDLGKTKEFPEYDIVGYYDNKVIENINESHIYFDGNTDTIMYESECKQINIVRKTGNYSRSEIKVDDFKKGDLGINFED